ncbi:MAG: hypothetical protein JW995_02900 [Melioribacteraceae bacterium]|nr:hypothetical protein [Melioribacteraceae bacterium]
MAKRFLFVFMMIITCSVLPQNSELENWLAEQNGIEFKKIEADSIFSEAFEIEFSQPIDHGNPSYGSYAQKLYVAHTDKNNPVVIETEGYWGRKKPSELSYLLNANYINVEHRYFGSSTPDSAKFEWKFLNIEQSANDHHRIINFFKEFYNNKWISTGISKGGQTSIYHKYYFPGDVDVSVPYVAPINFARADKRLWAHLETVADEECRQKVFDFQKAVLLNRDSVIIYFKKYAEEKNLTFAMGFEAALEYSVLEYSFAYWQWGNGDCSLIPGDTNHAKIIFDHLNDVSNIAFFSDRDIKNYKPFYYQAFTEIGFYDYDITPFSGLIKYVDGKNDVFFQDTLSVNYNYNLMKSVDLFVKNDANNMIYIYGGYDPWGAPAVDLTGRTNSLKMILPDGSHATRIKDFNEDERELIYSKLEKWLGITVNRSLFK